MIGSVKGIILAFILIANISISNAELVKNYDKFKDYTRVKTSDINGGWKLPFTNFEVTYGYNGVGPITPTEVALVFQTSSSNWVYLYDHDLILMADGVRYKASASHRIGHVSYGMVNETLICYFPLGAIEQLAKSNSQIEAKLGPSEFVFNDKMKSALRDIWAEISKVEIASPSTPTLNSAQPTGQTADK